MSFQNVGFAPYSGHGDSLPTYKLWVPSGDNLPHGRGGDFYKPVQRMEWTMLDKELKAVLRKEIRKLREELPEDERKELSRKVIENLKKLKEFKKAKTIMLYYPIKGEVDLTPLFTDILESGKKLLLPKVVGENIYPIEVNDLSCLGEGCFNIPEPLGGKIYKPEKIDLVVVPGVAFDKKGCRLGFGKGFYDRFLPRIKGFKVGVAYDFQVKEEILCEEHDIPLDAVITPSTIYRRAGNVAKPQTNKSKTE